jgi:hypothetical protein
METRGFYVWAIAAIAILGIFLIFTAAGWPGSHDVNGCVWGENPPPEATQTLVLHPESIRTPAQRKKYEAALADIKKHNTCYCEDFSVPDAVAGARGTRQKSNTWFNLYSIATSLVVAIFVYRDRSAGSRRLIGSTTLLPDVYIFAVLFLGLGSMWFHGAMKEWGGITDSASMYVFAAFLVFFTVRRFWGGDVFFWIAYPLTVVGFTILGAVLDAATHSQYVSMFLILALVATYAVLEYSVSGWRPLHKWRWWSAVGSILGATFFWAFSKTGGPFCDPSNWFQPHGLLWHPLAGVMAVFLYFYWRHDTTETA